MKPYEIFAWILGVVIFGVVCGYVGYIFHRSDYKNESFKPPHIILIVADDLGWSDVSFHGANQIPTPNIDALAYNGVILNRHYVLPASTPSRTALMTGRYPIRYGMQGASLLAGEPRGIPLNVTLMPEHLRRLGYETRLLGKWDLGYYTENHTPSRRGFDSFFGYYNGHISYVNKTSDQPLENGSVVTGYDLHRDGPDGLEVEFNKTEYFTDLITTEAEKIIQNNGNGKQLFLEISHLAAHATFSKVNPLQVRNVTENDEKFGYIKDDNRKKYAGIVAAMDESVGRVVKALSDASMLSNSIIVFMSDNGAQTEGFLANSGSNYPLRGLKNTLFEGGIRGAACVFSPLIKKPERFSEWYVHVSDWLPTLYSAAGGNVSNLGEIDGFDQWRSLVYDLPSPRENILLNIDEKAGTEAAIVGRHKLIKGAVESSAGYYEDTCDSVPVIFYPVYNLTETLNSTAGRAIAQLLGLSRSTKEETARLRENAAVRCEQPSNYTRCSGICLFDILSDPCETKDLSKVLPEVLSSLKSFIDNYRKSMVRQANTTIDPCSFPKYFNGTWMPWRRDDVNSSTIIPESLCNDHDVLQRNQTNNVNRNNTHHDNHANSNTKKNKSEELPNSSNQYKKNNLEELSNSSNQYKKNNSKELSNNSNQYKKNNSEELSNNSNQYKNNDSEESSNSSNQHKLYSWPYSLLIFGKK